MALLPFESSIVARSRIVSQQVASPPCVRTPAAGVVLRHAPLDGGRAEQSSYGSEQDDEAHLRMVATRNRDLPGVRNTDSPMGRDSVGRDRGPRMGLCYCRHLVAMGGPHGAIVPPRAGWCGIAAGWRDAWWRKSVRAVLHVDTGQSPAAIEQGPQVPRTPQVEARQRHMDDAGHTEGPPQSAAQDRELWASLERAFVARALRRAAPPIHRCRVMLREEPQAEIRCVGTSVINDLFSFVTLALSEAKRSVQVSPVTRASNTLPSPSQTLRM